MKTSSGKPVFIVFEGLDGTGKSTCAKETASLLGASYLTTPTAGLRTYRDEIIASFNGSQEAAQLFYLATVLAASDEVKSSLASGRSVVLDRYFLSTRVYAEFRGSTLDVDEAVCRLLLPANLTVFLEAPLHVRRERSQARGCSLADSETMSERADAALLRGYEHRSQMPVVGRLMRIDASTRSVREIAQEVSRAAISCSRSLALPM
ncbi:dTMP kinase [Rhodocyclus tenuis]|uniref:dTMP kinase n=1 Tax=Rhodocyclus tenuis TaxID=1066 RepID=UPI0019069CF6|nr:AAA family ATPase [Rhodocyclus tenuis]MBK1681451.1 hypothetical protein [Rhodocyclus tenuis]